MDSHPLVRAYIKNDGLNFTIPYLHNGAPHEYLPDFVIRMDRPGEQYLIAEMKGMDLGALAPVKAQAARRWCAAVNATGAFGQWEYELAYSTQAFRDALDRRLPCQVPPLPEMAGTGAGHDVEISNDIGRA